MAIGWVDLEAKEIFGMEVLEEVEHGIGEMDGFDSSVVVRHDRLPYRWVGA